MIFDLYHFTSSAACKAIMSSGHIAAQPIEIPGSGPSDHDVVSLTGNPDPAPMIGRRLWSSDPLTGRNLQNYLREHPDTDPNVPMPGPSTTEMKLTIKLDSDDPLLFGMYYPDLAEMGFASQVQIDEFMKEGGGNSTDWFIYRGSIPASKIVAADPTGL